MRGLREPREEAKNNLNSVENCQCLCKWVSGRHKVMMQVRESLLRRPRCLSEGDVEVRLLVEERQRKQDDYDIKFINRDVFILRCWNKWWELTGKS